MFLKFRAFVLIAIIFVLASCNKEKEPVKQDYFLKKLSHKKTGINFKNILKEDVNHSIINYIYFYNGGGVSAGDINNDGLSDLYFVSNQGENKLYLNKGNLQFEDITNKANVAGTSDWSTGTTMVDINNDGFLDIYVCAVSGLLDFKGHNELFINNGDGTFSEKSKEYGLDFKGYSTQSYFFDYDKDGDLDVYIVNHATHTITSHGKASLRNKRAPLVGDVLYRNDNGKFTDVSKEANIYGGINGYGLSASIADFNNDGWDDIYVCNDFHEDDYYYINNQDGTFREELKKSFATISRFSMGSDAADINGDGFQDLMTLDMLPKDERVLKETEGDDAMFNMQDRLRKLGYKDQYSRNMLQISNKGKYFNETALYNEVSDTDWSWGPLFADFNNDGHQDLFISNGITRRPNDLDFKSYVSSTFKNKGESEGLKWLYKSLDKMPKGAISNVIFEGTSKKFLNKTGTWIKDESSLSNGALYSDLDNDGDLDIVTNNVSDFATIYENTLNGKKNSLTLKLSYKSGNLNGIGTKALLYANGKSQSKQLFSSRGFLSSTDKKLYFGLDTISKADSLLIIWPDKTYQKIINPTTDKLLTVTYQKNNPTYVFSTKTNQLKVFNKENLIDYTHQEDSYYDFFYEKIIPYQVSTIGPAIAIGDIDGNGFEDVFIGNSSGNKAEVYLNNGTRFKKGNFKAFEEDKVFEDNDAAFFDADNDGDLDLYVASGINKNRNRRFEIDRLYINEKGTFKKSEKRTLINPLNTSCIAPYDYDNDGDIDLFIGNLSDPKSFGKSVNSAILINNGKGVFKANLTFKLNSMVTSAKWVDINNDNQKDLLVSTEWDTPRIYLNNKGKLTELKLPKNLNGLWQSISTFDIDNDGDLDILLGNWGENTKFKPTVSNPLVMYYGDFDSNNKKETVIAYTKNGKEYPVNSKSELAAQMNIISKRFVEHKNYALKTVEEVLTKEAVSKSKKYTVQTLSTGYLENNNGQFTEFKKLPQEFQLAPINSFTTFKMGTKNVLLVAGNSSKVNTYHGAYLSFKGLLVNSLNDYKWVTDYGLEPFNNQIKTTQTVEMRNNTLLIVVANNNRLKTYTIKK